MQKLSSHLEAFLSLPSLTKSFERPLRKLFAQELVPVTTLGALVAAYRRLLRRAARGPSSGVDLSMAERIADALDALIARMDGRTSADDHRILQATVRQCLLANEKKPGEHGLRDDVRLVNAALRWFGRDDLYLVEPPSRRGMRPDASHGNAGRDA